MKRPTTRRSTDRIRCACGNPAFKLDSGNEPVCPRCAELEKVNWIGNGATRVGPFDPVLNPYKIGTV